jgi:hypothetical protein
MTRSTSRGTTIGEFGVDGELADGGDDLLRFVVGDDILGEHDDLRGGDEGVMPVCHDRRTGVGLLPFHRDDEFPGVPALGDRTDGGVVAFQQPALLDVDLGVGRDVGGGVRPEAADGFQCLPDGHPRRRR